MKVKRLVSLFLVLAILVGTLLTVSATNENTDPTETSANYEIIEDPTEETADPNTEPPLETEPEVTEAPTEPEVTEASTEPGSTDPEPTIPATKPTNPLTSTNVLTSNDASTYDSGESGSNTGSGTGGSAGAPGSGTLEQSFPGVTIQVVTFPYKDSYNRVNSYKNVINTVKSYTTAAQGTTVYDGVSTTSNTFVADRQSGRIYKLPNFDINKQTGTLNGCWVTSDFGINPVVHDCVTVEMDGGKSVTSNSVTVPSMNDVEAFLQRIILGSQFGAWDIHDVALDKNGKTLEGNRNATSKDDYSTFAQVLRYLGVSETLINNYVKGYSGQFTVDKDGDTPIPTIIWSYVTVESSSRFNLSSIPSPSRFYYYDSDSLANGVYFTATRNNYGFNYTCYTVGDIGVTSMGASNYASWWKTAYASTSACLSGYGTCKWPTGSSFACRTCLGSHGTHTTYSQKPLYASYMHGSGYINHINAQGVDATSGTQYYFRGYWTPYGLIEEVSEYPFTLTKQVDASDECIQQLKDNDMYSLAGAKYEVKVNGKVVETLTTNAKGQATSTKKYEEGTKVYITEVTAPPGFQLNKTTYTFTIGKSNAFTVKDKPLLDPPFAITKVDKDTTNPQGNGSFSGAIFKWEYFDNTNWSGTATRAWYFKTNAIGYASYHTSYLASGYTSDELYVSSTGYAIPIGTVKITEIVNTLGYIVMPQPMYCTITADSSSATGTKITWTAESLEFITNMTTGNVGMYQPIDESLFGSLVVDKVDAITGQTPQGGGTFKKAKFQVINNSTNSVRIGDFAEAEPGAVCFEFYTDENGHYESEAIFPLGSYTVKEATPPDGYTLNTTWSQSFTVSKNQKDFAFTAGNDKACPNSPILGGLQIVKQDSTLKDETGNDALLNNISFSVISENDNPVVVNDATYQKGDTVLTMNIAWDGSQWAAKTANNVLPYGTYTVKENPSAANAELANSYYQLNTVPQTLTISENQKQITLTFENIMRPGEILINKVNLSEEPLAGAKLLLEWSEDGTSWTAVSYTNTSAVLKGCCTTENLVDGCLITDESGIAKFTGLHPGLQYRITEIEAPAGYQLLAEPILIGYLPSETMSRTETIYNSRGYTIPSTGIENSGIPVVLGTVMTILTIIGTGTIVLWNRRKSVSNGNNR